MFNSDNHRLCLIVLAFGNLKYYHWDMNNRINKLKPGEISQEEFDNYVQQWVIPDMNKFQIDGIVVFANDLATILYRPDTGQIFNGNHIPTIKELTRIVTGKFYSYNQIFENKEN